MTGKRDGVGFRNQSLSIEKKQRLLNKEMVVKLVFFKNITSDQLKSIKANGSKTGNPLTNAPSNSLITIIG